MVNTFQNFETDLNSPARNAMDITPSDTVDLPFVTRAIYVGTSGDIVVNMVGSQTTNPITYHNVSRGWHSICVSRVYATGTTADQMRGVW